MPDKKFSQFRNKADVQATDRLVGYDPTNPDPDQQNTRWSPQALATFINPLLTTIYAQQVALGNNAQLPGADAEGYTVFSYLSKTGSAALGVYYYVENGTEFRRMVFTNAYTGDVLTTEWTELTGDRSARLFVGTKDYRQDELVRYTVGTQRFFAAKQDLYRANFPGGLVPAPSGDPTDANWLEVSSAPKTSLFTVADETFVRGLSQDEYLMPGLQYRLINRPAEPGVDVIVVAGSTSGMKGQEAYTVPVGQQEPLTPVAYDLTTGLTSARASGSGAADTFPANFTVSLSNGKTFGKYLSGQQVPAAGKSAVQVLLDAAIEAIYPAYSVASESISQSAPADGEVGESISNTLTATFNRGDAGAHTQQRLYRNGAQVANGAGSSNPFSVTVQMVRSLTPSGLYAVVDYAAGPRKNVQPAGTPDDRTPAVRNPNAPQAAETGLQSGVLYFTGYYRYFYGPGEATSSAQVRALAGSQLSNQGNQLILNTGSTSNRFSVWLPAGRSITQVIDLDALNADITSQYVGASLSVNDAGGNGVAGTRYLMSPAVPYSSSHRHQITVS